MVNMWCVCCGWAKGISEVYYMFLQRTGGCGGVVEGGEDEGEAKGSKQLICAACMLWVRLQASVGCM